MGGVIGEVIVRVENSGTFLRSFGAYSIIYKTIPIYYFCYEPVIFLIDVSISNLIFSSITLLISCFISLIFLTCFDFSCTSATVSLINFLSDGFNSKTYCFMLVSQRSSSSRISVLN